MQYVAIVAGVSGVQHSIYCQYLQGVERNLIVVNIWSNICSQNRAKLLKNAPRSLKIAQNRSILRLRRRNTGSAFNIFQYLQGPEAVNMSIYCQYLQGAAVNIQHQSLLRNLQLITGWLSNDQAPPPRSFPKLAMDKSFKDRLQLQYNRYTQTRT